MKHATKILSLLLALMMVLSLGLTAFASEPDPEPGTPTLVENKMEGDLTGGSITITNAEPAETYRLYQLLYLESYVPTTDPTTGEVDGGQYSYIVNTAWKNFFKQTDVQAYFSMDPSGYVTWTKAPFTGTDVVNFTQLAMKYATDNNLQPISTQTAPGEAGGATTSLTFSGLKLGYYLIDSSLGFLCTLDTTTPEMKVEEKNGVPQNEKKVQEGSSWGQVNDATVGSRVNFKSTVSFESGTTNLIFHDKMDDSLDFVSGSVEIDLDATEAKSKETPLIPFDPDVDYSGDKDDPNRNIWHYKVIENPSLIGEETTQCTFHVEFSEDFYDLIETGNHTLTITYSAILNENAIVGCDYDDEGNPVLVGNVNISKVSYGEKSHFTPDSKTKTNTWEVPVLKFTSEVVNGQTVKTGLSDTKFILSNSKDGTDRISLVLVSDGKNQKTEDGEAAPDVQAVYRVATEEEKTAGTNIVTDIVTNESGKFLIKGLDSGTYYLIETEAHAGFNKLDGPVTIVIDDKGNIKKNETPATTIEIQNNSGSLLPSTGGIGTTIFYVVGSILLVGAAVLLITKKRVNAAQ